MSEFNGDLQKKIYEKVIQIETKMDNILATQKDHEKRIRVLEWAMWVLIGAITILNFVIKQ